MKKLLSAALAGTLCATVTVAIPGAALAKFPEKSVRIVVPYPPGGPTDIAARSIAVRLTQTLGQTFVIDNVSGAGGNIGTAQVAKAAPDGHTLAVVGGAFVINPVLYARAGYDAKKDFAPVGLIVTAPMILVVNPGQPWKNLAEFIATAKSKPGALNYASASTGGSPHLAMELLKVRTGISVQHVPYKGAAPALSDLVGGQVQSMMDSMLTGLQMHKAGKVRALAVSGAKRTPLAPEIPTIGETVPGFEAYVWYAAVAPAGTPRDVVETLNSEINKALVFPEVNKRLIELGTDPSPMSVAEFTRFLDEETVKWTAIVKASGAKVE